MSWALGALIFYTWTVGALFTLGRSYDVLDDELYNQFGWSTRLLICLLLWPFLLGKWLKR